MASQFQSTLAPERQAQLLVEFISVRGDRLSLAEARAIVDSLPAGDDKTVAQALKLALSIRRIKLKHVNGLNLAAKLAGRDSYHDKQQTASKFSALYSYGDIDTYEAPTLREAEDWVFGRLTSWVRAQSDPFVLTVLRDRGKLMLQAGNQSPFAAIHVQSVAGQADWDKNSPQFVERVRRLVEYDAKGFLDGYFSARYGETDHHRGADLVATTDSMEAGRGTELAVYSALETIAKGTLQDARAASDNYLLVGKEVYQLNLEYTTFERDGGGALHHVVEMNPERIEAFLKRYQRVQMLFGGPRKTNTEGAHGRVRPGKSGRPPAAQLDMQAVGERLAHLGKSLEWLADELGINVSDFKGDLELGCVLQAAEFISKDDYNRVMRKASRRGAMYATEILLRAALLEADELRFVIPRELDEDARTEFLEVCEDLHDSRKMYQLLQAGVIKNGLELAHFSVDADEFIASMIALGWFPHFAFEPMFASHEKLERPAIGRRIVFFFEPYPSARKKT